MRLLLFFGVMALFSVQVPAVAAQRIDDLIAQMTLEQKVGQMFLVGLYGATLNEPGRDFLQTWQPGGVVLFVSNVGTPSAVTRLTNSWQQTVTDAGGVPMFIATDQEGGIIARLKDGFTEWPVPMLLTASGNVDLAYRTGQAMANELSAVGVNMNLAPVADLYTNLRNPIIGRRSFGSDPERTGRMLAALTRGMQAGGIMATAKHFPGHGDTDRDSHTSLPIVQYPLDELQRVEFAPFRWTIAAGVEAMMVAHIWYPALDPDGTLPASLSPNVVTGLLRDEMDFRGLIMTDAIEMDAIDTVYSYSEASIMAINAGVDIVAFGAHVNPTQQARAMQSVVDAVRAGEIELTRIEDSVRRILGAKARYGVLNWQPLDAAAAPDRINSAAHQTLVQELFRAGVTVAYDRAEMLPLAEDARQITLIYPGSRQAIRRECDQYRAGLRWVSVSDSPSASEINSARSASSAADVVVVFTQNAGVNNDQQRLVNALPKEKTVAVALFSPYDWQAFPDVSAYLTTYSPLEPAIPAVCEVLFGAIPATGSLPVALDGQRDFASFAATEGITVNTQGVAVALAPRETVTPLPTLTPLAESAQTEIAAVLPSPETLTLTMTPAPSETRAPLISSTRSISITPTHAVVVIDADAPDMSDSAPDSAPTDAADSALAGVALIGLSASVAGYGALYWRAQRQVNQQRRTFVIQRCPVCGQGKLQPDVVVKRRVGIPHISRRTIRCGVCRSTLREVGAGRWVYRINPQGNAALYQQYNNQVVDVAALRKLEKQAPRH